MVRCPLVVYTRVDIKSVRCGFKSALSREDLSRYCGSFWWPKLISKVILDIYITGNAQVLESGSEGVSRANCATDRQSKDSMSVSLERKITE